MTIKIQKNYFIKILSFTVAIILILAGFIIKESQTVKKYSLKLNNEYSKNLTELNGNFTNIIKNMEKIIYSNSASQFCSLSSNIYSEFVLAKNSLSSLPNSTENELKTVNKFLSQVGDYTFYLSKIIIQNGKIENSQRQNLEKLLSVGKDISSSLNELSINYNNADSWNKELKLNNSTLNNGFTFKLNEAEKEISNYPTLIYDGPFSDHMFENAVPKLTKSEKKITKSEARKIVSETFNINIKNIKNGNDENSQLKSFGFYTNNASVSVTEKGGHIVFFRKYRKIKTKKISELQAVKKAKKFLANNSSENFEESYYFTDEGVCTVNFAYKEGNTVCYTDLIKVGIALDNGETVFLEAGNFLINHTKRTIPTPKYSEKDAEKVLSKNLTVNSVKQALIPSESNEEILCYEFNCNGKSGEKLLVYVNCNTLNEEKIFTVLNLDGGTLVE